MCRSAGAHPGRSATGIEKAQIEPQEFAGIPGQLRFDIELRPGDQFKSGMIQVRAPPSPCAYAPTCACVCSHARVLLPVCALTFTRVRADLRTRVTCAGQLCMHVQIFAQNWWTKREYRAVYGDADAIRIVKKPLKFVYQLMTKALSGVIFARVCLHLLVLVFSYGPGNVPKLGLNARVAFSPTIHLRIYAPFRFYLVTGEQISVGVVFRSSRSEPR